MGHVPLGACLLLVSCLGTLSLDASVVDDVLPAPEICARRLKASRQLIADMMVEKQHELAERRHDASSNERFAKKASRLNVQSADKAAGGYYKPQLNRLLSPMGPKGEELGDGDGSKQTWGSTKTVSVADLQSQLRKAKAKTAAVGSKLKTELRRTQDELKAATAAAASRTQRLEDQLRKAKAELSAHKNATAKSTTAQAPTAKAATQVQPPTCKAATAITLGAEPALNAKNGRPLCANKIEDAEKYCLPMCYRVCKLSDLKGDVHAAQLCTSTVKSSKVHTQEYGSLDKLCEMNSTQKVLFPTWIINATQSDPRLKLGTDPFALTNYSKGFVSGVDIHARAIARHYFQSDSNNIKCAGQCATKNGCRCQDGLEISPFTSRMQRSTVIDVFAAFFSVFKSTHHVICLKVPPRGCRWCDIGFDTQNPRSWQTPRHQNIEADIKYSELAVAYRKAKGAKRKKAREELQSFNAAEAKSQLQWLELKTKNFGACPKRYTRVKKEDGSCSSVYTAPYVNVAIGDCDATRSMQKNPVTGMTYPKYTQESNYFKKFRTRLHFPPQKGAFDPAFNYAPLCTDKDMIKKLTKLVSKNVARWLDKSRKWTRARNCRDRHPFCRMLKRKCKDPKIKGMCRKTCNACSQKTTLGEDSRFGKIISKARNFGKGVVGKAVGYGKKVLKSAIRAAVEKLIDIFWNVIRKSGFGYKKVRYKVIRFARKLIKGPVRKVLKEDLLGLDGLLVNVVPAVLVMFMRYLPVSHTMAVGQNGMHEAPVWVQKGCDFADNMNAIQGQSDRRNRHKMEETVVAKPHWEAPGKAGGNVGWAPGSNLDAPDEVLTLFVQRITAAEKRNFEYYPEGAISQAAVSFPFIECMHPVCNSAFRHQLAQCKRASDPVCQNSERAFRTCDKKHVGKRTHACHLEQYPKANGCQITNMKRLEAKCKKTAIDSTLQKQLNIAPNRFKLMKRLKRLRAPICASKAQVKLRYCNTCCCRNGLAQTTVAHGLVVGKMAKCGPWFSSVDTVLRIYFNALRMGNVLSAYSNRCFLSFLPKLRR